MAAYEIDLSFIQWDWAIPSHDLAQIYQSMNFTQINSAVIDSCNGELFAEVQAITRLPSEVSSQFFNADFYGTACISPLCFRSKFFG